MRIDTIFKHTNKTLPNVLVYFIRISGDLCQVNLVKDITAQTEI